MRQDPQFTAKLQEWMDTPDEQKDWAAGAVLLLQLTGNQIMFRNISMNPKGKAEFIKGQLKKYLNFRLQQLTHEEVERMQDKVNEIEAKVIKPAEKSEFADFKAGKRADHDTLPDEIKVLYAENLDIVHRMRELHLKLRSLSLENATCPDSERYPFLKEIIALDKKLHENWDAYDHFVADGNTSPTDEPEGEDDKQAIEIGSNATVDGGSPVDSEASETTDASESPESQNQQAEAAEDVLSPNSVFIISSAETSTTGLLSTDVSRNSIPAGAGAPSPTTIPCSAEATWLTAGAAGEGLLSPNITVLPYS